MRRGKLSSCAVTVANTDSGMVITVRHFEILEQIATPTPYQGETLYKIPRPTFSVDSCSLYISKVRSNIDQYQFTRSNKNPNWYYIRFKVEDYEGFPKFGATEVTWDLKTRTLQLPAGLNPVICRQKRSSTDYRVPSLPSVANSIETSYTPFTPDIADVLMSTKNPVYIIGRLNSLILELNSFLDDGIEYSVSKEGKIEATFKLRF